MQRRGQTEAYSLSIRSNAASLPAFFRVVPKLNLTVRPDAVEAEDEYVDIRDEDDVPFLVPESRRI